jgi:hypothetical protein
VGFCYCEYILFVSYWKNREIDSLSLPSQAVSSCASDAQYHVLWIILFNAIDDFGIKEVNEVTRMGHPQLSAADLHQVNEGKRQLAEEALHGALRIAGLVSSLSRPEFYRPLTSTNSCHDDAGADVERALIGWRIDNERIPRE